MATDTTIKAIKQLIEYNPQIPKLQKRIEAYKNDSVIGPLVNNTRPLTKTQISNLPMADKLGYNRTMEKFKKLAAFPVAPASLTSGMEMIFADPCKNNFFAKTESYLDNFFKLASGAGASLIDLPGEMKNVTDMIGDTTKGFIGSITDSLQSTLVVWIKKALKGIEDFFFRTIPEKLTAIATILGVEAAAIPLVDKLFKGMECLVAKASDAIKGTIEDMLTGMVRNITNGVSCVAQNMIGGLTNKISSVIDSMVGPFIGPLEKIFSPIGAGFNIKSTIMKGINTMRKIQGLFSCGPTETCPSTTKYKIDSGLLRDRNSSGQQDLIDKAFQAGALSSAVGEKLKGFEKSVGKFKIFGSKISDSGNLGGGNCDAGPATNCKPPRLDFFGGGGVGAAGEVLLGNFIYNFDKEDIFGDVEETASVLGVNITAPGEGYREAPLVAFVDECEQGYGAFGQAVIDKNQSSPTFGQVIAVKMIAEGEGYPLGNYKAQDFYVKEVIVDDPGEGYQNSTIEDFEICGFDSNGGITCVKPNNKAYRTTPSLNIIGSGSGAVLRPIITTEIPQTEIVEVIDCVT